MELTQVETATEKFIDTALAWIQELLPNLIGAILILIIGMWLSGVVAQFISKTMQRAKIGDTVISFVNSFVKIGMKVLVVIAAIGTLGFNIASIITALGAATVAIGLALQDCLKNVASGIMILINKPFKVGDYLEANGLQGTVKRIDISSTHLLTPDNKEVIMPNSGLSASNIVNYSSQENRRVDFSFSVSYNSDIDSVKKIINGVIDKNKLILSEPERFIAVGEHADSSVEFVVRVWCKTENYWDVYFYMQENIKKAFDENKIEIPFPQIDVHNS